MVLGTTTGDREDLKQQYLHYIVPLKVIFRVNSFSSYP